LLVTGPYNGPTDSDSAAVESPEPLASVEPLLSVPSVPSVPEVPSLSVASLLLVSVTGPYSGPVLSIDVVVVIVAESSVVIVVALALDDVSSVPALVVIVAVPPIDVESVPSSSAPQPVSATPTMTPRNPPSGERWFTIV